jgi:hypothetical protein
MLTRTLWSECIAVLCIHGSYDGRCFSFTLDLWLANMAIIIGMVVYGAKTDKLWKYEKKVQLYRGEVPVESA